LPKSLFQTRRQPGDPHTPLEYCFKRSCGTDSGPPGAVRLPYVHTTVDARREL